MDLTTAVASASTALDLLKTALKARDQALTEKAVADMVDQLRNVNMAALEASQEALKGIRQARAADQRIAELEAEVRELQAKADERDLYELMAIGSFSFAYALKEPPANGQDRHYLCQACFDAGKKLVLQRAGGSSILRCPGCKAEVRSGVLQGELQAEQERAIAASRRINMGAGF
ncbi:hypothetical protein [Cupriavidus sp. CP313]